MIEGEQTLDVLQTSEAGAKVIRGGLVRGLGYATTIVIGTLLAGAGLVLVTTQSTMMVPLLVDLRVGVLTAVEVGKQALLLVGIIVLVALGASLLPFFALQIGVGIVLLAVTPLALGSGSRFRPAMDLGTARMLIKETLPMAAAVTMNVIYFRVLVILMSLLATAEATGL